MHEASLVQGLLKIVNEACQKHNNENSDKIARVSEIVCEAGLLAGFESQALQDCFEIFAENTLCENAKLIVETAPLDCECGKCGGKFALYNRKFICPACGSEDVFFKGGNGLTITKINVETA